MMAHPFAIFDDSSPEESAKRAAAPEATQQDLKAGNNDLGHPADDHGRGAEGHAHVEGSHEISAADWTIQDSMDYWLNKDHLLAHVQDATFFEFTGFNFGKKEPVIVDIPNPMAVFGVSDETPMVQARGDFLGPISFQPTKFVVLELLGALIVAAIFIPYANRIKDGSRPKGRFWNLIDAAVCYVRDEIAVPAIGSHDAGRFLPLIWTIFFFILTLNLIGMVPGLGAATGSISVTAVLAGVVFATVLGVGMKKMGVIGFWKAQAPHMDLPPALKFVLVPMIWAIEVFGLFIKHMVLAVRLFANMFAGHLVVAVFVAFIGVTWNTLLMYPAVPAVIAAGTAINLLELLVAFIQAYVFAFLSALFIGAAIHPH